MRLRKTNSGNISQLFLSILTFIILVLGTALLPHAQQPADKLSGEQIARRVESSTAVVLARAVANDETKIGGGIFVREDGVLLTAYHLVKDAKEIQVRLKSGDVFDRVELLGVDVRRDVAALRIAASGIRILPVAKADEIKEGADIYAFSHPRGLTWTSSSGILSAIRLADEVPGAGEGFRLIQFSALVSSGSSGGVLVDAQGRAVGLITLQLPVGQNLNFAVPINNVIGLANASATAVYNNGSNLTFPTINNSQSNNPPALLPTKTVSSRDPKELFLNSKTVYVTSRTTFFKDQQLINELTKRDTIKEWGWLFMSEYNWNSRDKPDLIIELDHQIFTYNFTFTVSHRETSIILAAGKVIIADGASGSPKMVDRIIEKLSALIAQKPNVAKEKKTGTE